MAHRGMVGLLRLLADLSCNVTAWCLSGIGGIGVGDMLLGIRLIVARLTEERPRHAETSAGRWT